MSGATERPVNGEHVTNDAGDCISTCPACAAIVKAQRAPFTSEKIARELFDACNAFKEDSKQWQRIAVAIQAAEEEIERLTRERDQLLTAIGEHVTVRSDQYAEIQRLRAALEGIRRLSHEVDDDAWRSMALNLVGEALCGEPNSAPETGAHLGWREEELKCLLQYHDFHGRQMPDPAGAAHRYRADQLRGISNLSRGCHRSHPHENMDAECELLTEIAREQNASAQKANDPPWCCLCNTRHELKVPCPSQNGNGVR